MSENLTARLKTAGIEAKKTDLTTVPVSSIYLPPKGSPIWHPRSEWPIDEALCNDIVSKCEIEEPILVREDVVREGTEMRKVLTIVDGACRVVNGREADMRLHAKGTLAAGVELRVKIKLFKGDDKALLLARQRADTNPLKKAHTPSVLAVIFQQLAALECKTEEMLTVAPRSMTKGDVEAMLSWDNLHKDVQEAFDNGAPIGIIRAVLDVPRDEQKARLDALTEGGITHMKGATRFLNAAAKRVAHEVEKTAARFERDVATVGPKQLADLSFAPSVPGNIKSAALARKKEATVQRPHPKTMRKVLEKVLALCENPEPGYPESELQGFALGLRYALGENIDDAVPVKLLSVLCNAREGLLK